MELLVIHKQDLSFMDLVDLVVALMAVALEMVEQTDLVAELVVELEVRLLQDPLFMLIKLVEVVL